MQKSDLLQAALRYLDRGWSVIPVDMSPDAEGKPRKSALIPWTEFQTRYATPEELQAWWAKWPDAGIGIVTGKKSNLSVIDEDTPEGAAAIARYLPENCETPIAETPRGGRHLYFQYLKGFPTRAGILPGVDTRGEGGYVIAPPSRNGQGTAYRWLLPPDTELLPVPHAIQGLYMSLKDFDFDFNTSIYREPSETLSNSSKLSNSSNLNFAQGSRNDSLFTIANTLCKGHMRIDDALQVLEKINKSIEKPLPRKELEGIVESAYKRNSRCEISMQEVVDEFLSVTKCDFKLDNVRHFGTSVTGSKITPTQEGTIRKIIERRSKGEHPTLEHLPRYGWYHPIDNNTEVMDLLHAPEDEFPIELPLGVSQLCKVYPRNIIVIAGSKDAGKTAFLLNCARLNLGRYPMTYMISEGGDTELRLRLKGFEDLPLDEWVEKVRFIDKSTDWADLVTKDKELFIIDYMEPPEDQLYLVGTLMRKIHAKLKEGVCIIGLQKPSNRDTGSGDRFSMEKARIYLALDYNNERKSNIIKIVSAKAWQAGNPRGKVKTYKLTCRGTKYVQEGIWMDEESKNKK